MMDALTSLVTIISLAQIGQTVAWIPVMFNGRSVDGMVGRLWRSDKSAIPKEQYFEFQKINHFDGSDQRYWKQRYYINDTFHEKGGPIFLMLGGESEADPAFIVEGAIVDYARQYGALMVLLEHRYYGKSRPVDDLSPENLQYLNSRQALADAAFFVTHQGQQYDNWGNATIVMFGGGYAGSLAAWFRSRYPYIATGAVASSAPIVAQMDFQDYFSGVADALDKTGPRCKMEVMNATQTMFEWWGQPDKRVYMQKIFRLCHKINHGSTIDLTVFFSNLAHNFALVTQYNHDNRVFQKDVTLDLSIDDVCSIMNDESRGDPIDRYAEINSKILDTFSEKCLNIKYTEQALSLNSTSWNSKAGIGARQWLWQSCSEFGWFASSWSRKQPFGSYFTFPWNYTTDQCIDSFQRIFGGSQVMDNCAETNRFYGGRELPVSNVVFVNGLSDPWKAASVTEPLPHAQGAELVLIDGAGFCADVYPPTPKDSPQLMQAREKISNILGDWIHERT